MLCVRRARKKNQNAPQKGKRSWAKHSYFWLCIPHVKRTENKRIWKEEEEEEKEE
jgi:hypothetical protein